MAKIIFKKIFASSSTGIIEDCYHSNEGEIALQFCVLHRQEISSTSEAPSAKCPELSVLLQVKAPFIQIERRVTAKNTIKYLLIGLRLKDDVSRSLSLSDVPGLPEQDILIFSSLTQVTDDCQSFPLIMSNIPFDTINIKTPTLPLNLLCASMLPRG